MRYLGGSISRMCDTATQNIPDVRHDFFKKCIEINELLENTPLYTYIGEDKIGFKVLHSLRGLSPSLRYGSAPARSTKGW